MGIALNKQLWVSRCAALGLALLALLCIFQATKLALGSSPGRRLNQTDVTLRLERATELEMTGDVAAAEKELLAVAAEDRRFRPAWALAGFYYRQQRQQEFAEWLQRAAQMSYGDRTALFELVTDAEKQSLRKILPQSLQAEYDAYISASRR